MRTKCHSRTTTRQFIGLPGIAPVVSPFTLICPLISTVLAPKLKVPTVLATVSTVTLPPSILMSLILPRTPVLSSIVALELTFSVAMRD